MVLLVEPPIVPAQALNLRVLSHRAQDALRSKVFNNHRSSLSVDCNGREGVWEDGVEERGIAFQNLTRRGLAQLVHLFVSPPCLVGSEEVGGFAHVELARDEEAREEGGVALARWRHHLHLALHQQLAQLRQRLRQRRLGLGGARGTQVLHRS